ncbi:MAG TPA: biopolymer transporter ExbD, partial [Chitinophagaceae bacterium]|nr:biopolymer transporter ExbD [Chitinophagaceae bacterium]
MVIIDSSNKVYFTVLSDKDKSKFDAIIENINTTRNLGLTPAEKANYRQTFAVGVPFGNLKQLLATPADQQKSIKQPGIPVMDSANNELVWWIAA